MITFCELIPTIKNRLLIEKQNELIRNMRRFPPPVIPDNNETKPKRILDVRMEEDGTIRTYIENSDYPIRFYTPIDAVNVVANYKRLFSLLIKNGIIGILTLYLNQKVWKEYLKRTFELYPILLKEKHWSEPVKEIRRVLKSKISDVLLDAISLILENDMAYRYRLQDFLGELNKIWLSQNEIKELKRILDILIERELDRNVKIWKLARRFIWILRFKGLRDVREVLMKLDIDKVKLSKEDIYWVNIVPNYNYLGKKVGERL